MWNDELFTLHVVKQASPAEIVKAIAEGCDSSPPLYPIIVHSILPMVKHEALALRLPATIGYFGFILCLMAFCRRRLPAAYSLLVVLFACQASLNYATEGRPYGVVLGSCAGALLCWQIATEGRRRGVAITLLALCLALMVAMHYYSIFFLGPLFVAEMARARTTKRFDFAILAAMVPALAVLGLHYPLFAGQKVFQLHFWSPASLQMIGPFYDHYFPYFLQVSSLALVVLAFLPKSSDAGNALPVSMPLHERVMIGALTLLPPVVIIISTYTTHVFVGRYILWTIIGFALLIVLVLYKAARGQAAVSLALLGVLLTVFAGREAAALLAKPGLIDSEEVRQQVETLPDGPEPIVVHELVYLNELSYYAQPRLRGRFIYSVSRDLDVRYFGTDTDALLAVALSHHTALHMEEYDALLAKYPRFFLIVRPGDFLFWRLAAAGYRIVPVNPAVRQPFVFQVDSPRTN